MLVFSEIISFLTSNLADPRYNGIVFKENNIVFIVIVRHRAVYSIGTTITKAMSVVACRL